MPHDLKAAGPPSPVSFAMKRGKSASHGQPSALNYLDDFSVLDLEHEDDPVPHELLLDDLRGVLILLLKDPPRAAKHRHTRPEAAHGLRELEANDAAPDDAEALREGGLVEEGRVCHVGDVLEALDRRHGGAPAGRDNRCRKAQNLSVDFDLVGGDELSAALPTRRAAAAADEWLPKEQERSLSLSPPLSLPPPSLSRKVVWSVEEVKWPIGSITAILHHTSMQMYNP